MTSDTTQQHHHTFTEVHTSKCRTPPNRVLFSPLLTSTRVPPPSKGTRHHTHPLLEQLAPLHLGASSTPHPQKEALYDDKPTESITSTTTGNMSTTTTNKSSNSRSIWFSNRTPSLVQELHKQTSNRSSHSAAATTSATTPDPSSSKNTSNNTSVSTHDKKIVSTILEHTREVHMSGIEKAVSDMSLSEPSAALATSWLTWSTV